MNLLENLTKKEVWLEYLNYKKSRPIQNKTEIEQLEQFIKEEQYLEKGELLSKGVFCLDIPTKHLISKMGTSKKRVVYSFGTIETYLLKLITFLLHKYDDRFANNLFSFRDSKGIKEAINQVRNHQDCYAFKVDVSNYFNSINPDKLLPRLKDLLDDDNLYRFFERLLTRDQVKFEDKVIIEKCGAMAGVPISAFFANVYLMEVDKYFEKFGNVYARYSDDIIVISPNLNTLNNYKKELYARISELDLNINPDKETNYDKGQKWEFLGFGINNHSIDLSRATTEKIKGKIRRKCRALYRWKVNKGATSDRAIATTIRVFNRKFYSLEYKNELSWSRWFFPFLSTDATLKVIDEYLVSHLRYIESGRFTKKNYKSIDYSSLKALGYKSLVAEFWKYKKAVVK